MPEACLSVWPTDACEWSIADIWRWSDLPQRAIYISLALMLGYTIFVVIRFFRRYREARRELRDFEPISQAEFHPSKGTLIADLSFGLGTLRGIAYAAPLLGLLGTSYGILAAFSFPYGHRAFTGSFVNPISQGAATTLTNTALGILVAVLATGCHNLVRTRPEILSRRLLPRTNPRQSKLASSRFAQTLLLKRRFSSLPHFALLAVPFLACLLMVYLVFRSYPMTLGLRVRLLPIGSRDRGDDSKPLLVSILGQRNDRPLILVNSKQVPWHNLQQVAREKFQLLAEPTAYVEADAIVDWAYVADAIDKLESLHCRVVLVTSIPSQHAKRPLTRR